MMTPGTTEKRGSRCAMTMMRVRGVPSATGRTLAYAQQDVCAELGVRRSLTRANSSVAYLITSCSTASLSATKSTRWVSIATFHRIGWAQPEQIVMLLRLRGWRSPGLPGSGSMTAQEPGRSLVRARFAALAGIGTNPGPMASSL